MHPLYSPLGVLARWSDNLSRHIINLIPSNWGLILLCVMFAFFANETRRTAWENQAAPQKISARQFLTFSDSSDHHRYVSVTGRLAPKYSLPYSGSSSGTLVLMIDPASKQGFWIDSPAVSTDGIVEVSGLSWGMDSDLRSDVQSVSQKLERQLGLTIDPNIKLNAGQTPGNGLLPLLAEIALGAIALLFAGMSLQRNIVFQRQKQTASAPVSLGKTRVPAAAPTAATSQANRFLLSGPMRLHPKCARRFLAMPAEFARLSDGALALVTLTDASTYGEGGGVTKSRAGLWLCVPQLQELRIDEGRQFAGPRARPALRLRFGDALKGGRKSSVILSFDSAEARDMARQNLLAETQTGSALI